MSRPTLRLVAPRPVRERPPLDDVQRRVAERPVGAGNLMVVGAPGSGKTTTAMATFENRLAAGAGGTGGDVLLLVPSRRAAARVRDEISARLRRTVGGLQVRTPAAFAFSVLRARAALLGSPPPTLITGGEQDAILAELLAGHRSGAGRPPAWPASIPVETLGLRAFRDELRDVLMRAAEAGLGPDGLAGLGAEEGRAEWTAAAAVLREYEEVLQLGSLTPDRGDRYDAALIVDEAVAALREWERDLPDTPRPRLRTVIVDDHQDSTLATARLLRVLADDGAELVLFGDADAGVQGFRGGTPSLVSGASADPRQPGGFEAERVVLPTVWRQPPVLRAATLAVTERIGASGGVAHRGAPGAGPGGRAPLRQPATTARCRGARRGAGAGAPPSGVEVAVVRTRAQEAALVARTLREEHLHHGTDYAAMVVLVRSASQAAALRRTLAAAGVPVGVEVGEQALRESPAVRPLLIAASVVLSGHLTAETATDLLTSTLAGGSRLDAVSLRSLRRALRAEAAASGDARPIDELLVEVLADPERSGALPAPVRRAPSRVAAVLAAGRAALAETGVTAETLLWALWSAADLAEPWRRAALAGGAGADHADRDLDAVLTLFRTAEQYTERNPAAGPEEFVRYVSTQDLPADTLAARGGRERAVEVLTAATAAGAEWDVVVVAGVQEDVWPDLRIRGSILGAAELAQRAAGREPGARQDVAGARHEVLQDELRAFAVAISRARRRVLVTAVRDGELSPSPFLDLVDVRVEPSGTGAVGRDTRGPDRAAAGPTPGASAVAGAPDDVDARPWRDVGAPLDLRGLVARLRAELPDGPDAPAAARLLAALAAEGVQGADPHLWPEALVDSTADPLWEADALADLSPSAVETAQRCALRWALEKVGGRPAAGTSQSLGTLVHEIAAALPHGTQAELAAELERRWPELGLADGWVGRRQRERAEEIIRRLASYLASRPGPVEVEITVRAEVGRVRITGRADRVERASDGTVRVVDLKTGASAKSVEDAAADPQLAAYQVAIRHGALGEDVHPGGASLVYLAMNKEAAQRHQAPIAGDWAEEMLEEVAQAVTQASFAATTGEACRACPVRTSCPAIPDGERVSR